MPFAPTLSQWDKVYTLAPDTALTGVLESLPHGILVISLAGEIEAFNRKLASLWSIPGDLLSSRAYRPVLRLMLSYLKNPREFSCHPPAPHDLPRRR